MSEIKTYNQAIQFLYKFIPQGNVYKFPVNFGLERTKYLLKKLGNPQNTIKVIHIAGTSGKGSTAFFLSKILQSSGFQVGLSLSPHLLDIRERFQVNNKFISKNEFCRYVNELRPVIEEVGKTKLGLPTYFEITISLAYYIFSKLKLNYAVMETGLGGLYDGTNVVTRADKLAIITKIGHDHTKILGKTLAKIAYQKAGIIIENSSVITLDQNRKALDVIKKEAKIKKARIYLVAKQNTRNISLLPQPKFDFEFLKSRITDIKLLMIGSFQIQNCSLALAATVFLSKRDVFSINPEKIRGTLENSIFKGRMQQIITKGRKMVIDGAHNPQKMSMFIRNLVQYYPNQKFNFLVAFKRDKDYRYMLRYIIPYANKIIVSIFFNQVKFQGFVTMAEDTKMIGKTLTKLGFSNYQIFDNNKIALSTLLLSDKKVTIVVTGSLYLLSDIYPNLNK